MNKVKYLLELIASFFVVACTLMDVDDESDFPPAYRDIVGCWVSTDNIPWIDDDYYDYSGSVQIEVTPTSTCMEVCFMEDTSFSIVTKISKKNDLKWYQGIKFPVPSFVEDSVTEMYGYITDMGTVSNIGTINGHRYASLWVANERIGPYKEKKSDMELRLRDGIIVDFDPSLELFYNQNYRNEFSLRDIKIFSFKKHYFDFYGRVNLQYRKFTRSPQTSNCGTFGKYINTTEYTLDLLKDN